MVIPGSCAPPLRSDPPPPPMARSTSQSSLHDFSFPVLKTWGGHKPARCSKLPGCNGDGSAAWVSDVGRSAAALETGESKPPTVDEGHEKVRSKPGVVHLRESAHGIGRVVSPPRDKTEQDDPVASTAAVSTLGTPGSSGTVVAAAAAEIPWSLRTRRGAYNRPTAKGNEPGPSTLPPVPPQPMPTRSPRSRYCGAEEEGRRQQARRRKFSVVLSKEEIEEDVYALTGKRASRRPKKRPRALKKQLDLLFPGFYLDEVAPESYVVPEQPLPPPES